MADCATRQRVEIVKAADIAVLCPPDAAVMS